MGICDTFKIDSWWKAVFICGIALFAVSLLFKIELVNRKHLMGIGIGMFIIGLSNWIAQKTVIREYGNHGFFHGQIPIHNTFTTVMQVIGFLITILFGVLLIWGLI